VLFAFGPHHGLVVVTLAVSVWIAIGVIGKRWAEEAEVGPGWWIALKAGWWLGGLICLVSVTWFLARLRDRLDKDGEGREEGGGGADGEDSSQAPRG
jgi:hypothetical protein